MSGSEAGRASASAQLHDSPHCARTPPAMKKLLRGVVEFRRKVLPGYREMFRRLAAGQAPDALMIACSDSRVVPNLFASTDPGDLFVVRNVGNLVPLCGPDGVSRGGESEAAAIEFALLNLAVSDIIVCGHSGCGAMQAVLAGRRRIGSPNLRSWLRMVEPAMRKLNMGAAGEPGLAAHDLLSQANVLTQLERLHSYPAVRQGLRAGSLALHGWWFDIAEGDVYAQREETGRFVILDEAEAARVAARLNSRRARGAATGAGRHLA